MTIKEYQELKDRLWRDFIWAIPAICHCPNCLALLGFVTEEDIYGLMVEERLLETYCYQKVEDFLQLLVDRKASTVNSTVETSQKNQKIVLASRAG